MHATLDSQLIKYFAQKAPAGCFSGSKCNCIRPKGSCGTLFRLKIQLYPPKRLLRDDFQTFEISKNMFPGIFFGFDICNLKLFALKNRSSIVPSLQNIKNIQFLTILMSKMTFSNKCRKIILTGVEIRKKIRWIQWWYPFWLKPSKMTCFWWFSFWTFLTFLSFSILLGSAAWGFSL